MSNLPNKFDEVTEADVKTLLNQKSKSEWQFKAVKLILLLIIAITSITLCWGTFKSSNAKPQIRRDKVVTNTDNFYE